MRVIRLQKNADRQEELRFWGAGGDAAALWSCQAPVLRRNHGAADFPTSVGLPYFRCNYERLCEPQDLPLRADRPKRYDVTWKKIPMEILWTQAFSQPFVIKGL
jgi:hypothetical protein